MHMQKVKNKGVMLNNTHTKAKTKGWRINHTQIIGALTPCDS
mgnify:CR=1 FL=1